MPRELIRLESTGKNAKGEKTGHSYVTTKNKKLTTEKLEKTKFDPRAHNEKTGRPGKHVKYVEKKVK